MARSMPSNNSPQPSSNLPSFAEALAAARQMQQDWLEHGVNFVDLYVENVDGDWLEQWGEDEPVENGSFSSSIESIVTFLMSDDPVAIEARPFWENRPLPEIATHLERCLTLPERDRPYAVQDLLIDNNSNSRRSFNTNKQSINALKIADNLIAQLIKIQG